MSDLFEELTDKTNKKSYQPLAERMRPSSWDDYQGLANIDQNLLNQLRSGRGNPPSLVLWGPPGVGKTTFAKLVGRSYDCNFVEFSAVLGGVKEVREIVSQAELSQKRTILFVDEIHRFNKSQQDAFLPHVENGTIILIGATTENPSFYLNGALLSRMKVIFFPALSDEYLKQIAIKAASELKLSFDDEALDIFIELVGGDARQLLNYIESYKETNSEVEGIVTASDLKSYIEASGTKFYDRSGEEHYNTISAFIKSLRGSDPDAALLYAFWMLQAGEDPLYIIRRMMCFASEDIGNADPRALQLAVATYDAFLKLGMPEGELMIAQCVTYLACAPKSNRSYKAKNAIKALLKKEKSITVPLYLRNAPTRLMEEMGYAAGYQYPHDFPDGYAVGVQYLPDKFAKRRFYEPSDRGYEKIMKERLQYLRAKSK